MAKILLVEDDNNLREIYEARLQAEGYTIVSASDGEQALVVAKAEKPDLIISDVMMPKISGFEMLDILRNTEGLKEVKIIMLTALGQTDDQQRADRLGADRYLVKSQVTLEDIVKVTHELLGDVTKATTAQPEPKPAEPATPAPTPTVAAPPQPTTIPVAKPPSDPTSVATPNPASVVSTAGSQPPTQPAVPSQPTAPAPTPPPPVTPPAATVPEEPAKPVAAPPATTPPPAPPSPSVGEPAATPEAPSAAPAISPEVKQDEAQSESVAKSTAQEEATIEAKIENFVAGATTEAGPPLNSTQASPANPAPAPAIPPEPVTVIATTPEKPVDNGPPAEVIANDDKLMADAANALIADTEKEDKPAQATTTPAVTSTAPAEPSPAAEAAKPVIKQVTSGTPAQATVVTPSELPEDKPSAPEIDAPPQSVSNGNVTIAHKKVITPIDNSPKRDIKTLLALEEAKQAVAQGPPPPKAIIATNETGAQATPLAAEAPATAQATDFLASKPQAASTVTAEGEDDSATGADSSPLDPNNIAL